MVIGVLDIQGSVQEHVEALKKLDVEVARVKAVSDLDGLDGLIIPGGESTTIGKLLKKFGLGEAIIERAGNGMAIWGTCAGAILLAQMKLMNIEVARNAYGRQLDSFEIQLEFAGESVPAVFIRAPKIVSVGAGLEILAHHGAIVAAREGRLLATTFHPELTDDLLVHEYFVEMCGE